MRLALLIACALVTACQRNEVVVFHATSLTAAFGDLADQLKRDQKLSVRLEPSGSQVAVRKVTEQGLRADVVAVADDALLERLMVPQLAPRAERFATNELVLAHLAHSKGTDEISPANWPEVLAREGVRLGRVNEDTAPLGYHTLLGWQLAEQALGVAGLADRLRAACAREHVAADETELLALLEARAIDYAFLYRSTAEDHRLKLTALPDEANLSRSALAARYGQATVRVTLRSGDPKVAVTGRPISYALAVPASAPNPRGAAAFVEALRSAEGRRTLERHGFRPVSP